MNPASIEQDVRQFLDENYVLDAAAGALTREESLTRRGVLDSMGILELIVYLEERFSIEIPDEDTLPENLDTIDRIVSYVATRTNGVLQ